MGNRLARHSTLTRPKTAIYHDLVRDRTPPYERVYNDLKRQIVDGELLPGEQIPSLDNLSKEYSVSRVTARKAVLKLVDEGLLETRPAWGTFIKLPDS